MQGNDDPLPGKRVNLHLGEFQCGLRQSVDCLPAQVEAVVSRERTLGLSRHVAPRRNLQCQYSCKHRTLVQILQFVSRSFGSNAGTRPTTGSRAKVKSYEA